MTVLYLATFWQAWRPATCMPDGCFCEAIRQGAIAQPANFWSSFAFAVVGALVWLQGSRRLYGAALLLVGAGSAFYHASLTFAGQVADVAGMYGIATIAILYGLRARRTVAWFCAVNLLLIGVQVELPGARRYLFAALIVGVLFALRGGGKYLTRAILAFGIGSAFWAADITRFICAPDSTIQGHAIWHVAGAVATWFLALHFRDKFDLTNQIK